jgi:hypothetical protein
MSWPLFWRTTLQVSAEIVYPDPREMKLFGMPAHLRNSLLGRGSAIGLPQLLEMILDTPPRDHL